MWMILLIFVRCILAYDKYDASWRDGITADVSQVLVALNESAILSCNFITENLNNFTWQRLGNEENVKTLDNSTNNIWWKNETHGTIELHFPIVTSDDYGYYMCTAKRFNDTIYDVVGLGILPHEYIWTVQVLAPKSISIKWDVGRVDGRYWNSLLVQYRENGTDQWLGEFILSTSERILFTGTFDIHALKPSTFYEVKGVLSHQRYDRVWRYGFSRWVKTAAFGRIVREAELVIAESNERAVLSCDVSRDQITELNWQKIGNFSDQNSTNIWNKNKTHVAMELEFANVTFDDAGNYKCQARSSEQLISAESTLRVEKFDFIPLKIAAIGKHHILITWNCTNILDEYFADDDNRYVKLTIKYQESGTNEWHSAGKIFNSSIDPVTGHYVIRKLKNHTLYEIRNIFESCERQFHHVRKTFVFSKWVTTFEKDVEYVPTVDIVNTTMDIVTIKWSLPPPELREYIDAYLISLENGNKKEKYFRWEKYKGADRDKAVVYLQPSVSYDLVVRACFGDYCPDRHASAVQKGVMINDTAGKKYLRAGRESESNMEFSVLTMNLSRDAENPTAGSNASVTCSISAQGYHGWWTKEGEHVTSFNDSDSEINWTIIVGNAKEGNSRDYTCMAKITNDSHTSGTILVTVIPPAENVNVEAETVHMKLFEPTALSCDFFGYRLFNFEWRKVSNSSKNPLREERDLSPIDNTHTRMMLYFANTSNSDAGYYECQATNNRLKNVIGSVRLGVLDQSSLGLNVSVIGSKLVLLQWFDYSFQADTYLIRSSENGSFEWKNEFSVPAEAGKDYNGYVVRQLTRGTSYWFELVLISADRRLASTYSKFITPAAKDLSYFPNITVTTRTEHSITIIWQTPPEELEAHISVYNISVNYTYQQRIPVEFQSTTQTYCIIEKLQPSTSYDLEVKACFDDHSTDCYSSDVQRKVFTKSIDEEFRAQVEKWLPLTGSVSFLLIVLGAWHFYRRARKRRILRERLAYFYTENPISFNPELAISDQADLLPYEKKWEFPRKLLRLDEELGSGSFGIVWKARAKTIRRPEAISVVAVKTVRPTASLRCMKALLRELKILIYIGHHPNIVSLLGACTKDLDYGRLLVIVEFCRFGNLHDYLWRCRSKFIDELDTDSGEIPDSFSPTDPINDKSHSVLTLISTIPAVRQDDASLMAEDSLGSTDQPGTSERTEDASTSSNSRFPKIEPPTKYPGDFTNAELDPVRTRDLVSWAWQVSRGMQYLAAKKVLHGDLAARNVLLSEDNIVKICDFGLSKSLQKDDDYKDVGNDPLPVKWMAIESLRDGMFSVKSDVWSFGVVLWELFSLAKTPYPEINLENMCETLVGGYRMERPKYAPKSIYRTMLQCWNANPSTRPSFNELERSIGNLIEENVKMHYLELYTRCARVYAEITEFQKARAPESHNPSPLDAVEPTDMSQDEPTEKFPFRMQFKHFFRRE